MARTRTCDEFTQVSTLKYTFKHTENNKETCFSLPTKCPVLYEPPFCWTLQFFLIKMGAHTWVRDEKRGGGKTYASGAVAAPQPETKKRKLIWTRGSPDDATSSQKAAPAGTTAPSTETPLSNVSIHNVPTRRKQPAGPSNHQQNDLPEKDIAALRRKIEERQQRILQSAATSASASIDAERAAAAKQEERKRKLEAGFADAIAAAKDAAAAEIAASRAHLSFADDAEVQRVLKAKSDYAVLQLAPGTNAALVRRRYREMAVRLHPDKCKVQGASDAFQRLVRAYQQLNKYTQ